MNFKAQGSLEYLLVIGLVVLISAVVFMVLPSDVFSPKSSVSSANNAFDNLRWGGVSAISLVDVDSVSSGGGVLQLSSVSGVEGVLLSVYSGGVLLGSGSKDINLSPAYDCSSDLVLVSSSGKQVISKDKINCGGGSISSLVVGFVVPPSNFILVGDCVGLQNISNNLGASYRLTRSFDCSGFGDFVSIGSGVSPFTGVFDGAGFTVSGLVLVPGVDGLGLFGFVDGGGVVENLVLDGVGVVSGSFGGSFVSGGRVSFSEESDKCAGWLTAKLGSGAVRNGFVYNVPVSPNNTAGFLGVGGLVGCMYANSSVLRCSSSSPVVSVVDNAGGLVGYNFGGTITDSNATGSVRGVSNVGGLVGFQSAGSITNSFASGGVTGSGNNVGGLVGNAQNVLISVAYADNFVNGGSNVGGLVGNQELGGIDSCESSATVSGDANVGCLVGNLQGVTISNSVEACNNPIDLGSCWSDSISPHPICDCVDLNAMNRHPDWSYALRNDINCSDTVNWGGTGWSPWHTTYWFSGQGFVPAENFSGVFDGNYHTISKLFSNHASNAGLFASVNGGSISNVRLVDVNLIGVGVGALAGAVGGGAVISNSSASGYVRSSSETTGIGGLVGYLRDSNILDSFADVKVDSYLIPQFYVGGFVGHVVNSTISNCYSVGDINTAALGGSFAGGLELDSNILNSFATGRVIPRYIGQPVGFASFLNGNVINDYWDINKANVYSCGNVFFNPYSGDGCQGISDANVGYSTWWYLPTNPPMNSWDFVNTWRARGNNYPVLAWQPQ